MGCRVLDYTMWTVKEEGSKEHGFQLDLVHPMVMVSWIMGSCPFPIIFMLHSASLIIKQLFLEKRNLQVSA